MPVIPKDPMDWLALFRQQINEIFNFLSTLERKEASAADHTHTPHADIYETADAFVVEVDMPGMDRNQLTVNVCCNLLVIEALKRDERRNSETNYICVERHFGRFCKTVEIPPIFSTEGVSARYEKGILVVAFPRMKDKSVIRVIPIG